MADQKRRLIAVVQAQPEEASYEQIMKALLMGGQPRRATMRAILPGRAGWDFSGARSSRRKSGQANSAATHSIGQEGRDVTARTQALTVLRAHRLALARQFGVRSLALCGSVARD